MDRLVILPSLLKSSLVVSATAAVALASANAAVLPYKPSPTTLLAAYKRADGLRELYSGKAYKLRLVPHWFDDGKQFWYENTLAGAHHEYWTVSVTDGHKSPAFDSTRMADALTKALGHPVESAKLPITQISIESPGHLRLNTEGKGFAVDLTSYETTKAELLTGPRRPRNEPLTQDLYEPQTDIVPTADGMWTARIEDKKLEVGPKGGAASVVATGTDDGYFARIEPALGSVDKFLVFQVHPGERKKVFLIQSTPPGGGRAKLLSRVYDLPGDKIDTFNLWLVDPVQKSAVALDVDPVTYGGMPGIRWSKDGKYFTYDAIDRGFQRWRVFRVDTDTGRVTTVVEDKSNTFIDSTSQWNHFCANGEVLWRSERSGWAHLYITDATGKLENQITTGNWVVRTVDKVDEASRTIVFQASGVHPGEDPYLNHYFRVNFDGTGLTEITPEPGNHVGVLSPDGSVLVDTCSTNDSPPVHRLRRVSDGTLLATLDKADISELSAAGWKAPQTFVAKGRDGKTDIWGLVYRPSNCSPHHSYPIVEDIYAGPQDSFVPKDFSAYRSDQAMSELGFIVVKVDGMGTRNRSKAFQDVCWKNLGDAGFLDRILWMKALAAKYPYMDINRVGVYGTSAGGQDSTAAMLFHPEFYKVAVSSCGCHDNRMDKLWWNEQWMGYPVGPEYADQSNITNAAKLKGHLLLMVGELDTNVPPESTYRLVDALIKARKDFQFLVIPGSDHTDGGPYGERKRRDFFVHNLLGVEPPDWNAGMATS